MIFHMARQNTWYVIFRCCQKFSYHYLSQGGLSIGMIDLHADKQAQLIHCFFLFNRRMALLENLLRKIRLQHRAKKRKRRKTLRLRKRQRKKKRRKEKRLSQRKKKKEKKRLSLQSKLANLSTGASICG